MATRWNVGFAICAGWMALCVNHNLCVFDDFRLYSDRLCLMPAFIRFPRAEIALFAGLAFVQVAFVSRGATRWFGAAMYALLCVGMHAVNLWDWEPDEIASYAVYTAAIFFHLLVWCADDDPPEETRRGRSYRRV